MLGPLHAGAADGPNNPLNGTLGSPQPLASGTTGPPPSDATPWPDCSRPNVAAVTLDPVAPDTPAVAQQQGVSGDVTVLVSLDESSRVTNARIVTSANALLNDAALRAARASTYRTEVRDCRPIAADYVFIVEFSAQ